MTCLFDSMPTKSAVWCTILPIIIFISFVALYLFVSQVTMVSVDASPVDTDSEVLVKPSKKYLAGSITGVESDKDIKVISAGMFEELVSSCQ